MPFHMSINITTTTTTTTTTTASTKRLIAKIEFYANLKLSLSGNYAAFTIYAARYYYRSCSVIKNYSSCAIAIHFVC